MSTALTILASATLGAIATAIVGALLAKYRQDRSDHATVAEFSSEVLPWFRRPGPGVEDLSIPAQLTHLASSVQNLDVKVDRFGSDLRTHVAEEAEERRGERANSALREQEMRDAVKDLGAQIGVVADKVDGLSSPAV